MGQEQSRERIKESLSSRGEAVSLRLNVGIDKTSEGFDSLCIKLADALFSKEKKRACRNVKCMIPSHYSSSVETVAKIQSQLFDLRCNMVYGIPPDELVDDTDRLLELVEMLTYGLQNHYELVDERIAGTIIYYEENDEKGSGSHIDRMEFVERQREIQMKELSGKRRVTIVE